MEEEREEFTGIQLEILKYLKEHKQKGVAQIWSMEDFYNECYSDIDRGKFRETFVELEEGGYIERCGLTSDEDGEFGTYEITSQGLLASKKKKET